MVTVFGLGFVGLTTALGFAHLGYKVYGIDVDEERKNTLRHGELPFYEPYMDEVLTEHLDKNFFVTDDIKKAVSESEYIYYCVGTPYGENGSANLEYLFSAIDMASNAVDDDKFRVMVIKSTVPPSTTAEKVYPYVKAKNKNFGVANNPEFLREGYCWKDFIEADRIVLGCNDEKSKEMLIKLYEPMNIPIKCVSHSTGEFIKYLSNTLLATLISYSNEMSQVADAIGGIEIGEAFKILHMDKRWNNCNMTSYVYPGCGYGGYCLPKDTCALYSQSEAKGFCPQILKNVINTNEKISRAIAEKIAKGLDNSAKIGILGLSFKPNSDDVRDTPAAKIIKELNALGYKNIYAYDPIANAEFKRRYPEINIEYKESAKAVSDSTDVIAIVTAWDEFKAFKDVKDKKIIDCRYML